MATSPDEGEEAEKEEDEETAKEEDNLCSLIIKDSGTTSNGASLNVSKCVRRNRQPDEGGWGWIVVIASFFCNFVLDGMSYTFGILLEPLMIHFKAGKGLISFVGSLFMGVLALSAPIASYLVSKFGTRVVCMCGAVTACVSVFISTFSPSVLWLMLSFSVMGGFGLGLMYVPSIVAPSHYFNKRRSLALGLSSCGSGAGTFLLAPLVTELEWLYGWRGCNRILAGLCFQCVVFGALMKPVKIREDVLTVESDELYKEENANGESDKLYNYTETVQPKPKETSELRILFGNVPFLLILLGNLPTVMGLFIPYMFLPVMSKEGGLEENPAALISLIGIFNTISRIIFGWMTDFPYIDPLVIIFTTLLVGSLCPLLMISCSLLSSDQQFPFYAAVSILFGISLSALWALTSPLLVDLLGLPHLNTSLGVITAVRGAAAGIGPPIAGYLVDATENNSIAFWLSGFLLGLGGLLHVCAWIVKKNMETRRRKKYNQQISNQTTMSYLSNDI